MCDDDDVDDHDDGDDDDDCVRQVLRWRIGNSRQMWTPTWQAPTTARTTIVIFNIFTKLFGDIINQSNNNSYSSTINLFYPSTTTKRSKECRPTLIEKISLKITKI